MLTRPVALVIFDNDGVLVDSERPADTLLAQMLTAAGLPTTFEESIRTYMGGSFARIRRIAAERLGHELPDDFEERYKRRLLRDMSERLRPVDGARALLEEPGGRGMPFCVASGSQRDRLALSLRVTGIAPLVLGRVFSADDVAQGKPAPDPPCSTRQNRPPAWRSGPTAWTPTPTPTPCARRSASSTCAPAC